MKNMIKLVKHETTLNMYQLVETTRTLSKDKRVKKIDPIDSLFFVEEIFFHRICSFVLKAAIKYVQ